MSDITLVFPAVSDDLVSNLMIALTKNIKESGNEIAEQGFLGGEYGYGADYKNNVFEMRPFYWGDCTCDYDDLRNTWEKTNKHDKDCYQALFREMHYVNYGGDNGWNFDTKPGHGRDPETFDDICDCIDILYKQFKIPKGTIGSHVHCTCMRDINYANFLKTIIHADECQMDKPNFKHYASGVEVEWYKYIGRDMEYDDKVSVEKWVEIFKECIESLSSAVK